MLEIRDLRKKYGNFQALDGLSMTIEKGELFGFVGPNGAGKTTTIKIITGLLQPDSGSIVIDGMDGIRDRRHLKQKMGYVPDSFGVYDNLKVSEYMEFFASCYGIEGLESRKRCGLLLEQMKLEDKADSMLSQLSGGQKQRLFIILALIPGPRVVFLDELTTGLYTKSRREVWKCLLEMKDKGLSICLVSHFMDEVEMLCDQIGILRDGMFVFEGTVKEAVDNSPYSNLEDAYLWWTQEEENR